MGTNLPNNFTDGQELEASELNKMLTARTDSILPIDDTTRNNTDLAGSLGNATNRYTEAHIDNLKLDGNTISSTDTDGDINLTPDGAGEVIINGTNFSTNTDGDIDCTDITCNSIATAGEVIINGTNFSTNTDGDIDCTDITCNSIATAGNEALKFDVISATFGLSEHGVYNLAHGKGTNIRGVSGAYHASENTYGLLNTSCNATNIFISNISGLAIGKNQFHCVVWYV